MDDRKAMNAIFYVLRTGCQWKALPRSLGAASAVHDRFQAWRKVGVFEKVWAKGLLEYDAGKGIEREWQSMDTVMTEAPSWGEKARAPTRLTGRSQVRNAAYWSKGTRCHSRWL